MSVSAYGLCWLQMAHIAFQVYSNGLSEIILGNALKKLNLRREEVVIMTKARENAIS